MENKIPQKQFLNTSKSFSDACSVRLLSSKLIKHSAFKVGRTTSMLILCSLKIHTKRWVIDFQYFISYEIFLPCVWESSSIKYVDIIRLPSLNLKAVIIWYRRGHFKDCWLRWQLNHTFIIICFCIILLLNQ